MNRLRAGWRTVAVTAAFGLFAAVAWLAWPEAPGRVALPPRSIAGAAPPADMVAAVPTPRPVVATVEPRPVPPPSPAPAPAPIGPAVAIVIDDVGPVARAAKDVVALDGPLTLAFLAYADGLPGLLAAARARGHEVFLHLAMAPEGEADPGPNALLAGLPEQELRSRTRWALQRVPGAAGVNNHMGSRLTADTAAMAVVMDELARAGVLFLDSRTTPRSVAEQAATARGVPATGRDVFLDNVADVTAITAALEEAERIAREHGSAVAIGHPYPQTVAALRAWLPAAKGRGVRLVPVAEIIRLRACAAGAACSAIARRSAVPRG